MPATGLLPPLRTLVAVRAIAPVAGIPPNTDAMQFAIPWPMSSLLESCRSPVFASATTQDSRLSIAPRIAIVNAGLITYNSPEKLRLGNAGSGKVRGIQIGRASCRERV